MGPCSVPLATLLGCGTRGPCRKGLMRSWCLQGPPDIPVLNRMPGEGHGRQMTAAVRGCSRSARVAKMCPAASRAYRRHVRHLILACFRHFQRFVGGRGYGHCATAAAKQADLPCRTLRQVDHGGVAAHAVVDRHDHRLPGFLRCNPHARAEWQVAAGRGETLLIEDLARAGPMAVMLATVPGCNADRISSNGLTPDNRWHERGNC